MLGSHSVSQTEPISLLQEPVELSILGYPDEAPLI